MQDHPNRAFIQYIKNRVTGGFRFNFKRKRTTTIQDNLKLISMEPSALTKYIESEMAVGHICSPFTLYNLLCSTFQINSYGLVEKKGSSNKIYRVISHLSA